MLRELRFYALGIIIPIGFFGNIVSIIVLLSSKLRKKTPGQYFVALALADNVVLFGELSLWANTSFREGRNIGFGLMAVSNAACQSVNYLRYLGRTWSSLIVMTISIERLAVIIYPFTAERYSSPKTARIIILFLLVFSASISAPIFKYVEVYEIQDEQFCFVIQRYYEDFFVWCLSAIVTFEMIIPGLVICIVTVLIIYKLAKARSLRRVMQANRTTRERRADRQTNVTLIAVALAFLLLRPPYVVSYCISHEATLKDIEACTQEDCSIYTAHVITYILAILNYSVNFLLYFFTGGSFRNECYSCLMCLHCRRPPPRKQIPAIRRSPGLPVQRSLSDSALTSPSEKPTTRSSLQFLRRHFSE